MYNKRHQIEFEKHAKSYDLNAFVQKRVAKELVQKLDFKPKTILDLGCGTGEVYKNIFWEIDRFVGVDCSKSMCELHPKDKNVKIFYNDFESSVFIENVEKFSPFDLLISSSSLQWAKDIESTFEIYSKFSEKIAFSIFTNGTFKTIYDITGRKSFLPSLDYLATLSKIFERPRIEKKDFKVDFYNTASMLNYIKMSGTSGGNKVLNYKEIKYLLKHYPYNYLEFEVIFITN